MMKKKYTFDSDGRYTYGFTSSGLFTLIDSNGDSLYQQVIPLWEKLGSHLVWIFFWVMLIVATNLFFVSSVANRLFMTLIFLHLFLFSCRLTTLLLKGGVKPVLFPPFWIRITRQLQKGKNLDHLKAHDLDQHPGLLVNLALVELSQGNSQEGHHLLRRALSFCPDHPAILQLFNASSRLS